MNMFTYATSLVGCIVLIILGVCLIAYIITMIEDFMNHHSKIVQRHKIKKQLIRDMNMKLSWSGFEDYKYYIGIEKRQNR